MNVVAKLPKYPSVGSNDISNFVCLICALLAESQGKQYTDESGKTPLMYAILFGDIGLIKSMLDRKPDLSAVDESGKNALMYAAAQGNTEVVNILLESGVDINAVDQSGKTALMVAVDSINIEVINFLLSKGANPSIVDKDNQTAFDHAKNKAGLKLPELVNRRLTSSSSVGGGDEITFSKLIKKLEEIQSSVISRKTSYLSCLSRENPERDTLLQELKTILNKHYFDVSENHALLDSPGEALLKFCEKPIPRTTQ
ncbi:MAG: ankyrin repeat domain-containing protein [Pseudomonadota bacterium]|nr:ankyrin repeat domain-containing protein [Pseudomonadota bacterium]